MEMRKAGALALFLGAAAYITLMAAHPSGPGHAIGPFTLSGVVHATAFATKPLLVFGFLVFTGFLGFERPWPVLALVFYVLASASMMAAGTMSGLVFPFMVEAAHAPGADVAEIQGFARYTTWLNRSFAQVHYDLASVAIIIWSIAWRAKSPLEWAGRIVGLIAGLGVLGWHLSGTMNLEARQGALVVTLAHGVWTLIVAGALLAAPKRG